MMVAVALLVLDAFGVLVLVAVSVDNTRQSRTRIRVVLVDQPAAAGPAHAPGPGRVPVRKLVGPTAPRAYSGAHRPIRVTGAARQWRLGETIEFPAPAAA